METSYGDRHLKIQEWPEEDRPREKLLLKGSRQLSDTEILAILIGSGTRSMSAVDLAKNILRHTDNDLSRLAQLSIKELQQFKGIGEAKAINIVSALELGKRRKDQPASYTNKISCAEDVYQMMRPHLYDLQQEEFWLLLLNRGNMVLRTTPVSSGGVSGTIADPKLIFKTALEHLASAVIVVHNHPSGQLQPSEADRKLTHNLKQAGQYLEVPLLDHMIFTNDGYFSFADEGML